MSRRRYVKVTFPDGDYIETAINGTIQTICDYYHNNQFNLGNLFDRELQSAVSVEFLG